MEKGKIPAPFFRLILLLLLLLLGGGEGCILILLPFTDCTFRKNMIKILQRSYTCFPKVI
jgi:hypothetical protein